MNWALLFFLIGVGCGAYIQEQSGKKHYLEDGAIAVYEGIATCEKALDQLVCKFSGN